MLGARPTAAESTAHGIPATARRLAALVGVLVVATICAWLLRDVIGGVATLYPGVALPDHPYVVPGHALRLYVALPIVVVLTVAALLAPGLVWMLALGGAQNWDTFVLRGFAAAFLVRLVLLTAAKLAVTGPIGFGSLVATDALAITAGVVVLIARRRTGRSVAWPLPGVEDRRMLWTMLGLVALATVLLLPILFWQDLTDDALEGLEIGRTLAWFAFPRFPNASGFMGLGIGMITMAYPVHWLVLLIGPVEAAVRLPVLLYLPLLLAALAALIEIGSARRLKPAEVALLVLAMGVFVVTMGYNATYEPYAADIAAPTAFEMLTALCMLAAMLELWRGHRSWFVVFAVMAYFARPTGLLVVLLSGAAVVVVMRGAERRRLLATVAMGVAACVVGNVLFERVYVPLVAGQGGAAFPTSSILDRLRYLRFLDVDRLLYMAVPCGIVPAVALAAVRRQDSLSRIVTFVVVAYFGFFYVQAFIALHHFVPVMLLPLVVFWRLRLAERWPAWTTPVAAGLTLAALLLALPREWRVDRHLRGIGAATSYEIGEYGGNYAEYRQSIEHRDVIYELFPVAWDVEDPAGALVGASLGTVYYAFRMRDERAAPPNYLLRPVGAEPPPGFALVAETEDGIALVRDPEQWQYTREHPPSTDFQSTLYRIPRTTLFPYHGIRAGAYDVDLARLPVLWRLF